MPITFDCPACFKVLRIATRKAGFEVVCPNCKSPCVVPAENATDGIEEIDKEAHKAHAETSDQHLRDDGVPIRNSKKNDAGNEPGSSPTPAVDMLGCFILILTIFFGLGLVGAILGRNSVPIAFAIMIGIPIAIFVVVIHGFSTRCSNRACGRWWCVEWVSERVIDEVRFNGTVTRTAHTSGTIRGTGPNNPTQYTSSSTTYQERVPMVGITVRHSYKCSHCGRKSFKDVYNAYEA